MREKSIEDYFTGKLTAEGAICWKFVSPGHNGVPDRIVLYHGTVTFVELKAPGQKPRPLQEHRHAEIMSQGIDVLVVDSRASADDAVRRILRRGA